MNIEAMNAISPRVCKTVFLMLAGTFNASVQVCFAQIPDISQPMELKSSTQSNPLSTISNNNTDIHYHKLYWKVDPAVHYIRGMVESRFTFRGTDRDTVYFELADDLRVDSILYETQPVPYIHKQDELKIPVPAAHDAKNRASVKVYYQGRPDTTKRAFSTDVHDNKPVLWTLSEPYGAREWWPCKQTLNDKVDSIDIYVEVPISYKAASNGLLIDTTASETGTIYHWQHRHPITAYLIGIAVSNYQTYEETVALTGGREVVTENYVYPETIQTTREQTRLLHPVFRFYDSLLIPYPYLDEKYGHAQCNFNGGMEHQTMSFVGNFSLHLLNHELVHHWFGNYITCGSWQDIWLNEGFATYFEGLASERGMSSSDWASWKSRRINLATGEPEGSVYVYDTTSASRIFNYRLSYSKGAMLLHMLRWELGDDRFFESIRNYLQDTSLVHGYAKSPDLIRHVEETSGRQLDEFFEDWLYGKGFPRYEVQYRQHDNLDMRITLLQQTSHASVDFFEMTVPLLLQGSTRDTLIKLAHGFSGETFEVSPCFRVDTVIFDPESWIVTRDPVITNLNKPSGIRIQPSYASTIFRIQGTGISQIRSVHIHSITGRMVKNLQSPRDEINLTGLPPGIYIIRIAAGVHSVTEKIMLE